LAALIYPSNSLAVNLYDSQAVFTVTEIPSKSEIKGETKIVTGKIDLKHKFYSGTIDADLRALTTGNDLRDQHTKIKYLQVGTYPLATLEVSNLPEVKPGGTIRKTLKLPLKFHGVTQSVEVTVDMKNSGTFNSPVYKGTARFKFTLASFKVSSPDYLNIRIQDTVSVLVEFNAK
jgi:polyisoprenoid-binding protein YceI